MKNLIFAVLLLQILPSVAQDDKHPIDVQNGNCIENALPTTIGSINCEKEALQAWKVEMAAILERLKANEELLDVLLLEETQTKWLAFHKSNLNFYYSYYQIQYQGGTMARAAAMSYEKRQFRDRVLYLTDFYKELHGQ
jgi:uncharacterized protein YecT (DUF1311 family)